MKISDLKKGRKILVECEFDSLAGANQAWVLIQGKPELAQLDNIKLDQPKPVVPYFVAEWIEDHKGDYSKWDEEARADFVFRAINDLFRFGEGLSFWDFTINEKISEWTTKNAYEFITAILFGHTVEKEKLYTVEIPNRNGLRMGICRAINGICVVPIRYDDWDKKTQFQLTEAEIRKDFDWAFRWVKEVTE